MRLGPAKAKLAEAEELEAVEKVEHVIPPEFRGIGIRIEDDLLVTPGGNENLTSAVPVDIDEVEAVCRETTRLP